MAITSDITYNVGDRTAELIPFKNGVRLTGYTVDSNGNVILDTINTGESFDLQFIQFKEGQKSAKEFINIVDRKVRYSITPHSIFKKELKKTITTIELDLEINNVLVTNLQCNPSTNIVTLKPRPVQILSWSDFKFWILSIDEFIIEIDNFL